MIGRVGLEAEHVVGSVNVGVAYHHTVAVYYVYAVVVPVSLAVNSNPVDQQVTALVVRLVPAGRVAQGDTLNADVLALTEVDVHRAVALVGTAIAQRVVVQAAVNDVYLVIGGLRALPVDGSLTLNAYVVLAYGKDERLPVDDGVLVVVPGIGRAQQFGAILQLERHTRLDVDSAGKVSARGEHHGAATLSTDVIYGMLYDIGVKRGSVGLGPEVGNVIVTSAGRHAGYHEDCHKGYSCLDGHRGCYF